VKQNASAMRLLWVMAAVCSLTSLGFAWRFPLFGNLDRRVDLGLFRNYATSDAVWYGIGISVLCITYLIGLFLARSIASRQIAWPAVAGGVLSGLAFMVLYPVSAIDIFIYAGHSRLWTDLHKNPNANPINLLPEGTWTHMAGEWVDRASPYGPLWKWIAAPSTLFNNGSFLTSILILKAMALLAVLISAFLVADIVRLRGGNPTLAFVALTWNPLILWEGIGNGHNDTVMTLLIVTAIWFWQKGNETAPLPLALAATLLKYTVAILLPAIAVASLVKTPATARIRLIGWWIIDCGLVAGLSLWPYYDRKPYVTIVRDQARITLTSPLWLIEEYFGDHWSRASIEAWYKPVAEVLLAMIILVWLARLVRHPDDLIAAMMWIMFAYLLFAAWQYRFWYLIPVIALAAATGSMRDSMRSGVWAIASLATYWIFIWASPKLGWDQHHCIQIGTLVTFGAIAGWLVLEAGWTGWARTREQPDTIEAIASTQ
jgi:hypothetical protein